MVEYSLYLYVSLFYSPFEQMKVVVFLRLTNEGSKEYSHNKLGIVLPFTNRLPNLYLVNYHLFFHWYFSW